MLVTTLTKRMAEDLTQYYQELGVRVRYLHSDIDTLERVEILRDLRRGEFDVLVGINLLREGLDLPEVSLVAILDADKEGFLRSGGSLIQTSGRAARNVNGQVIMYADTDDRLDAHGDRRDRRGGGHPGGLQRGARHHADQHHQGHRRGAVAASTNATTRRPIGGRRLPQRTRSSTRTSPGWSGGCAKRRPTSTSRRAAALRDEIAGARKAATSGCARARRGSRRAVVIEWAEVGAPRSCRSTRSWPARRRGPP